MKLIRTEDAVGQVLCHDITQIIPGQFKGARFRKGHIVQPEDIPVLLSIGKENLYVWEKRPGILHEDEAAALLYKAAAGRNIHGTEPKEGKIELVADCSMEAVVQETAEEPTYYYEVRLEPKPVLRSYIAAAYELCNELTDSELVQMGHDRNTGRIRLLQALETVDALADYSEEAATEEFGNYMDVNFPNVTFKLEFVNPRAARWCGM